MATTLAKPPMAVGPGAGVVNTPPASVPLSFLVAGGVGLIGFGLGTWLAADDAVISPQIPGVISAVHLGVLAFLTMSVLGALHQFSTVVGRAPLRSVAAARVTLVAMALAAWLIPSGFAHGPESLIVAGGLCGAVAVSLAAWNLSGPLGGRGGGVIVNGLRMSVAYLVVTVTFGVIYAFDRQTGWFPLFGHRVLAHAHLGLLGWLGLTYVAVAEKLWPMFLLAHRPSTRSGTVAVSCFGAGPAILATGLLFGLSRLAFAGGVVVAVGVAAHVTSLAGAVKHRRRGLELLHAYLFVSTGFLVVALALGVVAGLAPVDTVVRTRLVAAEVTALIGWLAVAVVGHAHKIVPFISYTALRAKGIKTGPSGAPLLFADLFDARLAKVAWALIATGFASLVLGTAIGSAPVDAIGGFCVAVAGVIVLSNLWVGSRRIAKTGPTAPSSLSPPR